MTFSEREREILDELIEFWQNHAERCDLIENRRMAERQKERDLERVALLKKLKEMAERINP